jgi:3-oxoacid CoA-transferase subunit A
VELGEIPPERVDTPGVYVQHVIVGKHEKRIERRTTRKR